MLILGLSFSARDTVATDTLSALAMSFIVMGVSSFIVSKSLTAKLSKTNIPCCRCQNYLNEIMRKRLHIINNENVYKKVRRMVNKLNFAA